MFSFRFGLSNLLRRGRRTGIAPQAPGRTRLSLEAMEDRSLPSTFNVFPLPTAANGAPILLDSVVSLGGNLYFTSNGGEIGRSTPTGQITLNFAQGGTDLAVGTDGNLWTALGNTVRRITPGGTVTDFAIPTPNAEAASIAASADGNIWFEETSPDKVGRLNVSTGAITEFQLESGAFYEAPAHGGITVGLDGSAYVTQPVLSQFDFGIEKIAPDGTISGFTIPADGNIIPAPEQITRGPDGNIWFVSPGAANNVPDTIGRLTPNGQITEFTLPEVNGGGIGLTGITAGPDGNLYFNSGQGIGRITTSGQITENLLPDPNITGGSAHSGGITVGPDGNIWGVTAGAVEQLVIGGTATPPPTSPPVSPPVAAGTTTALAVSTSTPVSGQSVTLTSTVTSSLGTPSGTVTFFDGNTVLGTANLNGSGQATLAVALGAGTHALTASFGGTASFATSTSSAVTETVGRDSTTTALTSSAASPAVGQSVTFTATVTAAAPGSGAPTGTVTFLDGGTVLGTATVGAGGVATLTTTFQTAGAQSITAVYNGDTNFTARTSAAVTESVKAALPAPTATFTASATRVRHPATVGFSLALGGPTGSPIPTGTVAVFANGVELGTVTVDSTGHARFSLSFSAAGTFTITVEYSGDSNYSSVTRSIVETVL